MPRLTRIEGTIRLAIGEVEEQRRRRGSAWRKARPAESETSTVTTMTTRPSASERLEGAAEVADRLLLEQVGEPVQRHAVHREGQPALGPWKDRIRMVSVGP